jgi:hypothetical protein
MTQLKARELSTCGQLERVGMDGKVRRLPRRHSDIEDEVDPENYRTAFLLRADQAVRFASYFGPCLPDAYRTENLGRH